MNADPIELIPFLKQAGIEFEAGLSDKEVASTEARFNFRFPPDLRMFLQTALPKSEKFPNWRSDSIEKLFDRLGWPLHGFEFDVEHNKFWLSEWGERPKLLSDALEVVRNQIKLAPTLIPIYAHRYLPASPEAAGNPVFSVYQTDIIWYGFDLDDYLRHEFRIIPRKKWPTHVRSIKFWDPLRFEVARG